MVWVLNAVYTDHYLNLFSVSRLTRIGPAARPCVYSKYTMNEHDYPREWQAVVLRIVAARGLYYALGLLIGILAAQSRTDWDTRACLERLEDQWPK